MKKFICRLLIFMIPFDICGLFFLCFMRVGYNVGEFRNIDTLLQEQRNDHSIFIGRGYNEQTKYYKLSNANYYQADVIALGTSRVMQFKDDYFGVDFYNCGGVVKGNYDEYLNFLKNLTYNPRLIILGLDQWVFNDSWNQDCTAYLDYTDITLIDRNKVIMTEAIIKDWFRGEWTINELDNYNMNYGFNGRIKDDGFQWDGSYYYGNVYRTIEIREDYRLVDVFKRIDGVCERFEFEWGLHVDDETLVYLERLLEHCKNNNIEVIGFAPPFAPSVYSKMVESGNYGYLDEISPMCEKLFEKYSYEYYDYTRGDVLRADDSYYIDGMHGSEVVYAYMIRDMLNQNSNVRLYIDEEKLDRLLEDCYSTFLLEEFVHAD